MYAGKSRLANAISGRVLDSTVVGVALPKIGQELPPRMFSVLEAQSYVYNGATGAAAAPTTTPLTTPDTGTSAS